MARPKIEHLWEEAIRTLTENEPQLGPLGIQPRLEWLKKTTKAEHLRVPSLRTIGRIQRQFRPLPEEERRPYRIFRWPESMEQGALPWEASAAALELLREHHKRNLPRPLLGAVRWFWRVSEAAPTLSFEKRFKATCYLRACEVGGAAVPPEDWRRVEARVALDEEPESWFGQEGGPWPVSPAMNLEHFSEMLTALYPMFTPATADSITDHVRTTLVQKKEA